MSTNVVQLPAGPHWRVLVAHRRADVRHVLRTLIEADHVAIVEAADGDAAFEAVERARYDLLVLELDLPGKDGVTLMQLHRVLLMHERIPVPPPAIVFTLPPEVRGNVTLTGHLHWLGADACIDDEPRSVAAAIIDALLRARAAAPSMKPNVA
jgi:chemotaxis response regulator CheB